MIILYKKVGETPLACVQRTLDTENNIYAYAGRLDPMAEGLLLVTENEECKNANAYYNLHKTYDYEFITGISTDTYDCLGEITAVRVPSDDLTDAVSAAVRGLRGMVTLPYPPYSSKPVNGRPLFAHARRNALHTITVPEKTVHITHHELTGTWTVPFHTFRRHITDRLRNAPDGFRREEIVGAWNAFERDYALAPDTMLRVYSATVSGSGGMYVRALVHAIGNQIGCPTVTTRIVRTAVGPWTVPGRYQPSVGVSRGQCSTPPGVGLLRD